MLLALLCAALLAVWPTQSRGQSAEAERLANARRVETERAMRKIRAEHFRARHGTEARAEGYEKLRTFRDPDELAAMLEVFERTDTDAQRVIYGHLADVGGPTGRAALAWEAVFDADEQDRAEATRRLWELTSAEAPIDLQRVIARGLGAGSDSAAGAAAGLADRYGLIEAVPMMIAAQSGQPPDRSAAGERTGSLGFISVVTQRTFVSDLQPVVADGAVGFDPSLSVVNEGVVLSVDRATVTTYRSEVNRSLVRLTSRVSGQDTSMLGYDPARWADWYEKNLRDRVAEKLAGASGAEQDDRSDGDAAGVGQREQ